MLELRATTLHSRSLALSFPLRVRARVAFSYSRLANIAAAQDKHMTHGIHKSLYVLALPARNNLGVHFMGLITAQICFGQLWAAWIGNQLVNSLRTDFDLADC